MNHGVPFGLDLRVIQQCVAVAALPLELCDFLGYTCSRTYVNASQMSKNVSDVLDSQTHHGCVERLHIWNARLL